MKQTPNVSYNKESSKIQLFEMKTKLNNRGNTTVTAKLQKTTIQKHFQKNTRTKSKGQINQKPEKLNTNLKTVLSQEHHR